MNRSTKRSIILGWLSTSTAVLVTASPALAQDATVGVGATTTIPPRGRVGTGDPSEGRPATAVAAGSAHEAVVGRLGVGWFGTRDVPVGPATMANTGPIPTPIVGIRYWMSSMLGIDAGFGLFSMSSATRLESPNMALTTEGPTRTSILFHAGLPLSLADVGNF